MYDAVPPVADAVAPPSDPGLHETVLSTAAEAFRADGSKIEMEDESVHPFASVMVTEYVPATTPVMEAVVAPLLQT